MSGELTEEEKKRAYDWALARESAKCPDMRLTIVVADRTDFDGLARYTAVATFTTTFDLKEMDDAERA